MSETKPIAANAHANRVSAAQAARDEARAELLARNADTTTPIPVAAPSAQAAKPAPLIVISTEVVYRGRIIRLTADPGMSLIDFCDLLDRRFGVAE